MAKVKKIKLNDLVVHVSPACLPALEHPWFQRLKFISQVETVCLSYPGATQNRFQHSLGAYELARMYVRYLHDNSPDIRISDREADAFMFAALYHDIGHCAFSHAFDRTVAHKVYPVAKPHDQKRFDLLTRMQDHFVDIDTSVVRQIWNREHYLSVLLNGPLSVDRMDFINRDILYTGKAEFGRIPMTEIMEYTYLHESGETRQILYDARRCRQYADFLNIRQSMYETVYFHHKSVAGSLVIDHLIKQLERFGLRDLYQDHFESITDDYLLNWVRFDKHLAHLQPLVDAITVRRDLLPRMIKEYSLPRDEPVIREIPMLDDEVVWHSGPLEGFTSKAFTGINFWDRGSILAADTVFSNHSIKDAPCWELVRCYHAPLFKM